MKICAFFIVLFVANLTKAQFNFSFKDSIPVRVFGEDLQFPWAGGLNNAQFSDLDFESYLKNSVFVIEWGSDFVNTLTDQFLEILIKQGETENSRIVSVIPIGERWAGLQL